MFSVRKYLERRLYEISQTWRLKAILRSPHFRAQAKRATTKDANEVILEALALTRDKLRSQTRIAMSYEKKLAIVSSICNVFSQSLELDQVLRAAADSILEIMEVEIALIFRLDDKAKELVLVAYEGVSPEFAQGVDKLKLGEGFNGLVAEVGEPLLVRDASRDPRLTREIVRQEGLKGMLIVPMKYRGEVRGTLCVGTRQRREFTVEEIELLTIIGSEIYICFENVHLYQEQLAIAEQLRQSERNYRELFEHAHDAIWIHDLEGNILAANRAAAELIGYNPEGLPQRLTGYDLEELSTLNVKSFLSQESLRLAREVRRKLLRGETPMQPYEQHLIRVDGTEATLMLTTNLISKDGQPKGFQNSARDITEEKRMQENLRLYVQQITRAQEEERSRIAHELHDSTVQTLIALLHQVESLLQDKAKLPLDMAKALWGFHEQIRAVLQEVRYFSRDLRPAIIDDLGLLPALEWLTEELKTEYGVECTLNVLGNERRLSQEKEVTIFRIVQEAVRNIGKHSQASSAEVSIRFKQKEIILTVKDNGIGFQVPESVGDLARAGKLGLVGMEERVRLLDGSLKIQSNLGQGTTIIVKAPV